MPEHIELSYFGDAAGSQILDLYDAGRALYGAARFIYTLENFRVNGTIVEHATSAQARFELRPARPGSFVFDIQHVMGAVGPENAAEMLKIPLAALIAWITRRISGEKKQEVDPAIRQAAEGERERATVVAVEAMRDVALRAIDASEASEKRQLELIAAFKSDFEQIPEQRVRNLMSKLRPPLIDMARPTKSSATYMSVSVDKGPPLIYMDETSAENLKGNQIDDIAELTVGKFIQYNVETGWGKVRLGWRLAPYRFFVHRMLREEANPRILSAMNLNELTGTWFYRVSDKSGNVSSLLFQKFPDASEIPAA